MANDSGNHKDARPDPEVPSERMAHPSGAPRIEDLLRGNLHWLRGWLGARLSGYQRQEVDDLCQEVLLRAVQGARKLRRPDRFAPWLYRIASNVLTDFVRRRAQRAREVPGVVDEVCDPRNFTKDIDREEELQNALRRVLALPSRYREPMILRHVEDLSYAEIGMILGISENAVQVRIFRARQMVRRPAKRPGLEVNWSRTEP